MKNKEVFALIAVVAVVAVVGVVSFKTGVNQQASVANLIKTKEVSSNVTGLPTDYNTLTKTQSDAMSAIVKKVNADNPSIAEKKKIIRTDDGWCILTGAGGRILTVFEC